jgi:hypothetical protein
MEDARTTVEKAIRLAGGKFVRATDIAARTGLDTDQVRRLCAALYASGRVDRLLCWHSSSSDTVVGYYGIREGVAPGTGRRYALAAGTHQNF